MNMKIKKSTIIGAVHGRKNKKILAIIAVLALALFFGAAAASAQGGNNNGITFGSPIEVKTIATVNIYEAKIISQDKNRVKIGFDLDNREGFQPGVKYSVELIKTEGEGDKETQIVIDEKVYDEKVSLGENETVHREIEYVAPDYLSGDFTVYITCNSDKGMGLGIAMAGKMNLNGNDQFIEIKNDTCYLTIKGENNDNTKKYFPDEGVDISKEEKLMVNCKIKNNFSSNVKTIPNFITYYRNIYGERVSEESQSSIDVNSKEEKGVVFEIPIAKKSQAYDVVLFFSDKTGKIISNKVVFHYVLQGRSATVENLIMDKNYYQKGDMAELSFFWYSSADSFFGARVNRKSDSRENLDIVIKDNSGKECSDKKNIQLDPSQSFQVFQVEIKSDCVDPKTFLALKDENGNVLDSSEYQFGKKSVEDISKKEKMEKTKNFLYMFSVILVLLVIAYSIVKKRNLSNLMKVFFFVSIISSYFFCCGQAVRGDSFSISYGAYEYCLEYGGYDYSCGGDLGICPPPSCLRSETRYYYVNFYGNLNKKRYSPGEIINVTGKMPYLGICSNNGWSRSLSVVMPNYPTTYTLISGDYMDDDCGHLFGNSSECKKKVVASLTFQAPSVPGDYNAVFYAYANHAGTAKMEVPFTVTCKKPPIPNPGPGENSYISKSEVEKGEEFEVACDYGVVTNGINATVGGGGSCVFSHWIGTAANFKCTAGSLSGLRNVSCMMKNIASDYYCSGTDNIGQIKVIGNNAPTAKIDIPAENPYFVDKNVEMVFSGQGTDTDGSIKLHRWFKDDQCTQNPVTLEYSCVGTPVCRCSGDPMVCESNPSMQGISGCAIDTINPSKSSLRIKFSSVGQHNIFYQVQDNKNKWSNFDTKVINVTDPEYFLTVKIVPSEGGTVKVKWKRGSETIAEECSSDQCDFTFNQGTVTLTAIPNDGYRFKGWSGGGLDSSGNPASFTIKANKTTTSQFEKNSCTPNWEYCKNNAESYCEGVLFKDSTCEAYICEGTKKCTDWKEVKR